MGNCTASQRAAETWADDGEWQWEEEEEEEEASSPEDGDHRHHHRRRHHHHHHHHDERREEDHHDHDSEVTIRITKRQLHELMEKNGSGHGGLSLPGLGGSRRSAEQLLADIMNSGEVHHHHHKEEHWHWKPALQSIPEAVES